MEVRIKVLRSRTTKGALKGAPTAPKRGGVRLLRVAMTSLMFACTVIGGFETGRAIWTYSTVARAAELGAKYASSRCSVNAATAGANPAPAAKEVHREIEEIVKYNTAGLDPAALHVVTTFEPNAESGAAVQVRVSYALPWLFTPLVTAARELGVDRDYEIVVTKEGYSSVG